MASGILAMISTLLVFIQRIQFMFATDNPISFIQRGLQFFHFFGLIGQILLYYLVMALGAMDRKES